MTYEEIDKLVEREWKRFHDDYNMLFQHSDSTVHDLFVVAFKRGFKEGSYAQADSDIQFFHEQIGGVLHDDSRSKEDS